MSICRVVVVCLVTGPSGSVGGCWARHDFLLGWQAVYSSINVAKSSLSCSWGAFLCAAVCQLINFWNNLERKAIFQESGNLGILQPLTAASGE